MDNELKIFPEYYKNYSWDGKHKLFGYPADTYPDFLWIASLEKRFIWLRINSESLNTASIYLIREMIEWGGSQNGVLQKFTDNLGEINLYQMVQEIIHNLDEPEKAIRSALSLPGLGLTYASKLLRFMQPSSYGALDHRIRDFLFERELIPRIYDGNTNSMVAGYVEFLNLLNDINNQLYNKNIDKPKCILSENGRWKPSEIEMAIFRLADKGRSKSSYK